MCAWLIENSTHTGIGVMSGTSLDGVDLALCQFTEPEGGGWSFRILHAANRPYPEEWRKRLATAQDLPAESYARLNVEYGHLLGELIRDFAAACPERPDFAACHGHTIFHQPENRFTAQSGDGETIAAHLDFPVVCNFRNKDVALGGEGAPLVPFGEKHLFGDYKLLLNLGGFANLSAGKIAFDISPCNFALNWAARQADSKLEYDPDGRMAREGTECAELLEAVGRLDYYHQAPPKSLGREWFETRFLPLLQKANLPPRDLLNTLCQHIAVEIRRAIESQGAGDTPILITGGGARNTFLMEQIQAELDPCGITVEPAEPELIDYKEALIFAFLGLHTLLSRPNILPSVTGARRPCIAGSIHLP